MLKLVFSLEFVSINMTDCLMKADPFAANLHWKNYGLTKQNYLYLFCFCLFWEQYRAISWLLHCILRLTGIKVFSTVALIFWASSFAFVEKLLWKLFLLMKYRFSLVFKCYIHRSQEITSPKQTTPPFPFKKYNEQCFY